MASIEKTRAIIEENETYDGKITPTVKSEISRPVKIKPGATVEGSIYGETINIDRGKVEGSVMGAESVELESGNVDGDIGTDGRITSSASAVYGTITGQRVRLTNTIVYGNVVGSNVVLENCVVIGLITAETRLSATNTLCYSFKTYGEATLTGVSTVLPQAIVEGKVEFDTPVTVTGLGQLDIDEADFPTMDEDDLIELHESTYLTLSPRILNLEVVTDRLEELELTLQKVVTATSGVDTPAAGEILNTLGVSDDHVPDII
ncbi:hypothetical protein DM826_03355 [Halonotius aquaticus]|uniref:Polymer-forming protein n=1 Tax=Halonotius aquaticus TaxID=2216978 RepID=A0A3A6Q0P3_9EURY|nr:polymer-forming cytoskeletal protein [Halonotius aquaticus]RJX44125.1 hypothetical protein DM826_03355 [Halonotius aquaticus]